MLLAKDASCPTSFPSDRYGENGEDSSGFAMTQRTNDSDEISGIKMAAMLQSLASQSWF